MSITENVYKCKGCPKLKDNYCSVMEVEIKTPEDMKRYSSECGRIILAKVERYLDVRNW
jgi:hypothetical protein